MSEPRPLVIVVDDALALRLVLVRALTEAGFDALSAPDGSAAATLILGLKHAPDAVVTDIRMPVMGGERLASWLTQEYPRVPIIFISGFVENVPSLPGPLLTKPFEPGALCNLVRQAIAAPQASVPA
jgi:CheY-like chemotaxis protein